MIFKVTETGFKQAISRLYRYQDQLPLALMEMEKRLMQYGITVAESKMTDLEGIYETRSLITFKTSTSLNPSGCTAILMEVDIRPIVAKWKRGGKLVEADVSPSWMLEFGSGQYALEGHQGTFPNQRHAFDEEGWTWTDENGEHHHSYGIQPTQPMHHAMIEMYSNVYNVIKEVFL